MDGFDQLSMNWRSALTGLVMMCSLIVIAFLWRRGVERAGVAWFAAFVVTANISAVPALIGFAGAYDIWPGLTFLPTQTAMLYGPLILLHAKAVMERESGAKFLWLLAPGIAYWLYQLWAFTMLGSAEDKWAFTRAVHDPFVFPAMLFVSWVLLIGCVVHVWRLRASYTNWLAENRSDTETFEPQWITHMLIIVVVAGLYWIIANAVAWWFAFSYFDQFNWDFVAQFAIFVLALEALSALTQPFPKMPPSGEDRGDSQTSGTSDMRDWLLEGTELKARILKEQWYLEPDLSLQELARRMGTNQTYLSRAINQGLGVSYSAFINGLRVDYAKRLIASTDRSMIEIALESGFGSKASFNRAFKAYCDQSPTAYRDQVSLA